MPITNEEKAFFIKKFNKLGKIFIFGSSVYSDNYRDIDIAILTKPINSKKEMSENICMLCDNVGVIKYNCYSGPVHYDSGKKDKKLLDITVFDDVVLFEKFQKKHTDIFIN